MKKVEPVSCIIPTRNRHGLLQRALESVASQTYRALEIIIVDDASEDETERLATDYANKDRRIKYFRNAKALGAGGSRNIGILRATGKYISFLDDDDLWMPEKIERQVQAMKHFDAVLCASVLQRNGRGWGRFDKPIVQPGDLRKGNLLGGNSILMAEISVTKENLFDQTLPSGQDWDLLIRISGKYKVGYLPERLVIYNNGKHERITNDLINAPTEHLDNYMRVLYKHRQFFGANWFNYHVARYLLSYFKNRQNKMRQLMNTAHRCGLLALVMVCIVRPMLKR